MVILLAILLQSDIDAAIPAAKLCSDEDFVRRVHLDLAGTIPTLEETKAFLEKPDRAALIDRLLASPDYARRMEETFTVMLLERRTGEAVSEAKWSAWLRKKFEDDAPWADVVQELLAADGRDGSPAVKFFLDGRTEPHRLTQDVARLFLGKNLTCAQCHDHPHVRDWSQAEYMGLYAFLGQNKAHKSTFMPQPMPKKIDYENVFRPENKKAAGPALIGHAELEIPAYAKGQEWEVPPGKDGTPGVPKFRPRERLAAALVAHPQFARTAVNRVWYELMGRGFVHPIDMDHSKNPASRPELLDALSKRFTRFKPLVREIVMSRAYQSADALLRPIAPEALARSVARATGFKPGPQGKFKAKDYLAGKKSEAPSTLDDLSGCFAAVFGAPPGEPEVGFSVSTTQALYLRNDRLLTELAAGMKGDVEELYLRILSRRPTDEERAAAKGVAASSLAWALLASAEFRLNH